MNIAFMAPGFSQMVGGITTNISHAKYSIPAHDRKTKQQKSQKKPQINADERRIIITTHRKERKVEQDPLNFCNEKHPRNRTRMTRIARIFTDTVNPCVSASSAQSVFYRYQSTPHSVPMQCERRWAE